MLVVGFPDLIARIEAAEETIRRWDEQVRAWNRREIGQRLGPSPRQPSRRHTGRRGKSLASLLQRVYDAEAAYSAARVSINSCTETIRSAR